MCDDEWIQELQATQPRQHTRWHGAPSTSASMQQTLTMPPFQSHNPHICVQDSPFDTARHSNSAQHHVLGHTHALPPPISLYHDYFSTNAIGMMSYWPQEYIGTPFSYANNLMQYQNARHNGAFMQDITVQHDHMGMLMNADVQHPTIRMQDTLGLYHNVSTSANTEARSGDMHGVCMGENIAAEHQNVTTSMNAESFIPMPVQVMPISRHELAAARWASYYHDRDMGKVHAAVVQQGQLNANSHASEGTVMMMKKGEFGRSSIRLAEKKVKHHSGKDRHSKVKTAKGMRDRRVRLSVSTAAQFYDIQDRLGFQQPSRVFEWLMQNAKHAIDQLPASHSSHSIIENDPDGAAAAASTDHRNTPAAFSFNHLHASAQDAKAPAACSEDHDSQATLNMRSS